ncbi:MAG TPA: phytanoyl-CoA dioxygenase [Rhodospirillales bacterium]|nr:phytanoyl-CoA dioxygenase [Rhodospirillales bacterium]
MNISKEELESYWKNGFLVQNSLFSIEDTQQLIDSLTEFAKQTLPGHVSENGSSIYRAFHGCHLYDETYDALIRKPELLQPARQVLKDEVYIHQLKVNLKHAFSGDLWPWHQDYIYWRNEDKMPTNALVNVMIFLDDVTEFNGPLYFIPGSHQYGCIEVSKGNSSGGWEDNVSASLTYQVAEEQVSSLVNQGGLFSAKGKKGTAIWFDGNLVHASPQNISPFQRRIVILTYNAVSNSPLDQNIVARPDFLNARARQPLRERLSGVLSDMENN